MKARKRKNRFYRIWQKQIARNAKMLRLVYGNRRKSKLVARAKICSKGKHLLVNKWVDKDVYYKAVKNNRQFMLDGHYCGYSVF